MLSTGQTGNCPLRHKVSPPRGAGALLGLFPEAGEKEVSRRRGSRPSNSSPTVVSGESWKRGGCSTGRNFGAQPATLGSPKMPELKESWDIITQPLILSAGNLRPREGQGMPKATQLRRGRARIQLAGALPF